MMVESLSDIISILTLAAFPFLMLAFAINSLWKHRKAKIRANREQYYREW